MSTEINYIYGRARTTEFVFDVLLNGDLVACANTYHGGEVVAEEITERDDALLISASISALKQLDQALSIEIEGMTLCAPCADQDQPCAVCDDRPLLAQCAAVIRRCLGRTTGAGSIIDELHRVDAALRSEGW